MLVLGAIVEPVRSLWCQHLLSRIPVEVSLLINTTCIKAELKRIWKLTLGAAFQDLQKATLRTVRHIARSISFPITTGQSTVALLCPSSERFLLYWLALMRSGHAVLLIACVSNILRPVVLKSNFAQTTMRTIRHCTSLQSVRCPKAIL